MILDALTMYLSNVPAKESHMLHLQRRWSMSELTLGSLFDGSGGFPLGGVLAGITPLWSSEIEPFAVRVTTKRLPQMEH